MHDTKVASKVELSVTLPDGFVVSYQEGELRIKRHDVTLSIQSAGPEPEDGLRGRVVTGLDLATGEGWGSKFRPTAHWTFLVQPLP